MADMPALSSRPQTIIGSPAFGMAHRRARHSNALPCGCVAFPLLDAIDLANSDKGALRSNHVDNDRHPNCIHNLLAFRGSVFSRLEFAAFRKIRRLGSLRHSARARASLFPVEKRSAPHRLRRNGAQPAAVSFDRQSGIGSCRNNRMPHPFPRKHRLGTAHPKNLRHVRRKALGRSRNRHSSKQASCLLHFRHVHQLHQGVRRTRISYAVRQLLDHRTDAGNRPRRHRIDNRIQESSAAVRNRSMHHRVDLSGYTRRARLRSAIRFSRNVLVHYYFLANDGQRCRPRSRIGHKNVRLRVRYLRSRPGNRQQSIASNRPPTRRICSDVSLVRRLCSAPRRLLHNGQHQRNANCCRNSPS